MTFLNRTPISAETLALQHSPRSFNRGYWRIPCPAHGGTDPNLSLWDTENGGIGARCFSHGCDWRSIMKALGVEAGGRAPRRRAYEARVMATYQHRDGVPRQTMRTDYPDNAGADGPCRYGARSKAGPCGRTDRHKHDWIRPAGRSMSGFLPKLWTLDDPDNALVIVEGEPAAGQLAHYVQGGQLDGVTPVSWYGGSGVVRNTVWDDALRGRTVIVWPDPDKAGAKALADVISVAHAAGAAQVLVVPTDGLYEGQDAADLDADECERRISGAAAPQPGALPPTNGRVPRTEAEALIRESLATPHGTTLFGAADRMMSLNSERLMIVSYVDREGNIAGQPYLLDWRGLWRPDAPALGTLLLAAERRADAVALDMDTELAKAARAHYKALANRAIGPALEHMPRIPHHWRDEGRTELLERLTRADRRELDGDGRYLGCANGVVDLRSGRLLPPDDARRHFVTRETGVRFDPKAKHEVVDRLTAHLPEAVARFLWRKLGRTLWGLPDGTFLLIVGPTAGGKSTLIKAVSDALGDEAGTFGQDLLRPERGQGKTGPTPERQALVERRLIFGHECESWNVDIAKLKAFTSGIDALSVQPKYQAEFTARAKASMVFVANSAPRLGLSDAAVMRRFRIVEYPALTLPDPAVMHAVQHEPAVRVAMLARLVRMAQENPPEHEVPTPAELRDAEHRLRDVERGPFGAFLAAHVESCSEEQSLWADDLWDAFCRDAGQSPDDDEVDGVKRRSIARIVQSTFQLPHAEPIQKTQGGQSVKKRGWRGLRFRSAAPQPSQARLQ